MIKAENCSFFDSEKEILEDIGLKTKILMENGRVLDLSNNYLVHLKIKTHTQSASKNPRK
jgi:hypothetical protein